MAQAEEPALQKDLHARMHGPEAHAVSVTPTGIIVAFGGTAAPGGWLLCNGAAVSRTTYAALFSVLSTAYGTGDGSTTFNVPDLRGRVPVGKDSGTFVTLGSTGGSETHALSSGELAAHTHTGPSHSHTSAAHSHSHSHGVTDPQHNHTERSVNAAGGATTMPSTTTTGSSSLADGTTTNANSTGITINTDATSTTPADTGSAGTGASGSTGSGTAHNNLQPWQSVNYIIRA